MRLSSIIGLMAAVTRKSKYKVIFVGIEFAYLLYVLIKRQKEQQKSLGPASDDTSV